MTFDASDIVRLVLWVILGALVLSLILVVVLNKTAKARWSWSLGVVALFGCMLAFGYYRLAVKPRQIAAQEAIEKGRLSEQEFKERYAKAKALFDARCKTAGMKVYKTVENVEGVTLETLRPRETNADRANQNWEFAALPSELGGDGYIKNFLYWEHLQPGQSQTDSNRASRSYLNSTPSPYRGFRFVDVKLPDGSFQRYRLLGPGTDKIEQTSPRDKSARYAVSYTDISEHSDRANWVAGAKVQIFDRHENALLAEHVWYAFEPGLGDLNGSRSPWGFAKVCPQSGVGTFPTRLFVEQVLKPKRDN